MADVVVVGGGLIGALAALGVAHAGRRVTVLERREPERQRGRLGVDIRNVAVSPASRELLEAVGVWASLEPAAYQHMEVWEERGTRGMHFDAAEVGRAELGWILESSQVVRSLWDLLQRHRNVRLEVGAELASIRLAASSAVLETDRGDIRARLVVAADGGRSRVRELLAVPAEEASTGHHALATVVRTEQEHGGTCLQRFLLEGPLALLPTADARLSSVVWSQPAEEAERRAQEPDSDFCLELERCLEARFGKVEAVDARVVFPLAQTLVSTFNPHHRVLLIGDAARVVHPLAGMGANIGFEDVRDLLAELAGIGGDQDPGAPGIWRRFARQRRLRSQMVLALMSGFRRAYSAGGPLASWVRNTGVGWLDRAEPLKAQIMREALGVGPLARRW
jgi:ubiquinone biosynthesis UbiH/UbiF/VisC/COQ6 family hydroxylase